MRVFLCLMVAISLVWAAPSSARDSATCRDIARELASQMEEYLKTPGQMNQAGNVRVQTRREEEMLSLLRAMNMLRCDEEDLERAMKKVL